MESLSGLNMARLMFLIEDVSKGKVRQFPYEIKKVPKAKFLTNLKLVNTAASIGWSNLGMAIWHLGRHLPTRQLTLKSTVVKQMMKFHVEQMIELAKKA